MIQLKPTNLYAVIVPEDYTDYLLGKPYLPDLVIIGTATKDTIDFDFEKYLWSDKAEGMFYKYGNGSYDLKDRQNAFYHLLAENGLHFVNPIDPKRRIIGDTIAQLLEDYTRYEDGLVKKLLILKTI